MFDLQKLFVIPNQKILPTEYKAKGGRASESLDIVGDNRSSKSITSQTSPKYPISRKTKVTTGTARSTSIVYTKEHRLL